MSKLQVFPSSLGSLVFAPLLAAPAGAFYCFPRIEGIGDGLAFCRRVLAEAKVGIAPGYTFGPGNEAHFRLCFARKTEEVEEAARRIVRVIDRTT